METRTRYIFTPKYRQEECDRCLYYRDSTCPHRALFIRAPRLEDGGPCTSFQQVYPSGQSATIIALVSREIPDDELAAIWDRKYGDR